MFVFFVFVMCVYLLFTLHMAFYPIISALILFCIVSYFFLKYYYSYKTPNSPKVEILIELLMIFFLYNIAGHLFPRQSSKVIFPLLPICFFFIIRIM